MAKDLDSYPKKIYKMANKHMKRCSTSLVIKVTQIKTVRRYHFIFTRVAIIKKEKQKITSVGKDVKKMKHNSGRTVEWYSCCGKQFDTSSKSNTL